MVNLEIDINKNYGGDLINQKYSPLEINKARFEKKEIQSIFEVLKEKRIKYLENVNALPGSLSFIADKELFGKNGEINILEKIQANDNEDPIVPMVVISSNRSDFIKAHLFPPYINIDEKLSEFNYKKDFLDKRPLWYSPLLSKRPLFIVVHRYEYSIYKEALNELKKELKSKEVLNNFHVIGWNFIEHTTKSLEIMGFGASRFAAIKIAKSLKLKKIWLIDDNVFCVRNFPEKLIKIEKYMDKNELTAISFQGATSKTNLQDINKSQKQPSTENKLNHENEGILQQVVLWNINQLKEDNISPYFIASNEDISFTNYLKKSKIKFGIMKGMKIIKGAIDLQNKIYKKNIDNFNHKIKILKKNIIYSEEFVKNLGKNNGEKKDIVGIAIHEKSIKNYLLEDGGEKIKANIDNASMQAAEQIYTKALNDASAQNEINSKVFKSEIPVNWIASK